MFYGWWNPIYVPLLLVSILVNFGLSANIRYLASNNRASWANCCLALAISLNIAALGYFKYAKFVLSNWMNLFDLPGSVDDITLPLGISFFTFTQIAYLIDTRRGTTRKTRLLDYTLFVTYFPHLLAGPILHHHEMMPQIRNCAAKPMEWKNMAVGLTVFFIGLYKKLVLADGVAVFVGPTFDSAATGLALNFADAWGSALAYSLQIYLDFSGYSDMAIGLSCLFGIALPINFNSPYKAKNIIDFWRRWHISLSRFLRDYIYIPLGGNRHGAVRRYTNLGLTMLIGGFWHGANWTFLVWGALHGIFLIVNTLWISVCRSSDFQFQSTFVWRVLARLLTLLAVIIAWVFFRATTLGAAMSMLEAMSGVNADAFASIHLTLVDLVLLQASELVIWVMSLFVFCLVLPNTQEIMSRYRPGLTSTGYNTAAMGSTCLRWKWNASPGALLLISAIALHCFYKLLFVNSMSEFLYFNF